MNILSRVLLRFGYVRLREFGYTLTREGRIIELPRVTDDRFAPPPWEPIAWQNASAFLPPHQPPVPRPLPPPPYAEVETSEPRRDLAPETLPPVSEVSRALGLDHDTKVRSEPEDEEWEWRMALARARERASDGRSAAAVAASGPATPPARIAHPADPDASGRSATQLGAGPGRAPASTPPPSPRPGARSAPVSSPPGRPMGAMLARPTGGEAGGRVARGTQGVDVPASLEEILASEIEEELELEPDGMDFADGSGRHGIVRAEAGDATALDVQAIRPDALPTREDDDVTSVDVGAGRLARARAAAPAAEAALPEAMTRHVFPAPASSTAEPAPLPRLSARLRRQTPPH